MVVISLVFFYALWTLRVPNPPQDLSATGGAPATRTLLPEMVPLVTGDEPTMEIFMRAGCPVCHTIPGILGANGRVGPPLVLGATGSQRLTDPSYRGQATTVREYVIESVMDPGVFVVPGYPERTMPTWYGTKLSALALEKIATYLEQQTEAPSAP